MAVSFQEQSRKRKLIYTGLILGLFTATLLHRLNLMDPMARKLALRQEHQGAVEIEGSSLRLLLTGSRGLATCFLWYSAIEKQKRHEWNELSFRVRTVTKLQPHFITPWLFQSWNLAYNVSVENDRIRDKYFYITQGIELLADGERKNRSTIIDSNGEPKVLNHPDLCFNLGFYYQQKIGTHDNQNTLLSLLQMSGIDPKQRDPHYLWRNPDTKQVDMERFEEFCHKHPILIRRLREVLGYGTPREIVQFLADNRKLPTLYVDDGTPAVAGEMSTSRFKPLEDQFPVLAPLSEAEKQPDDSPDAPDFNTYSAARGWFTYAQRPLPPTDKTFVTEIKELYDRSQFRMPKSPAHLIFRAYPARAQHYIASQMEKEGWFDDQGWRIEGWPFKPDPTQKGGPPDSRLVGQEKNWALDAWRQAYLMYQRYGEQTGLWIDNATKTNLKLRAQAYQAKAGITPDMSTPFKPEKGDPLRESFEAHEQLFWYERFGQMTNFPHFYHKTRAEQDRTTIRLRKAFFEAERLRGAARRELALEKYSQALPEWRKLLGKEENKEFRHDPLTQEEAYETQKSYLVLTRTDRRPFQELKLAGPDAEDWRAPAIRHLLIVQDRLGKVGSLAALLPVHLADIGPFDWLAPDGRPLISDSARSAVDGRKR